MHEYGGIRFEQLTVLKIPAQTYALFEGKEKIAGNVKKTLEINCSSVFFLLAVTAQSGGPYQSQPYRMKRFTKSPIGINVARILAFYDEDEGNETFLDL
jgi:hypothetical protein